MTYVDEIQNAALKRKAGCYSTLFRNWGCPLAFSMSPLSQMTEVEQLGLDAHNVDAERRIPATDDVQLQYFSTAVLPPPWGMIRAFACFGELGVRSVVKAALHQHTYRALRYCRRRAASLFWPKDRDNL